jgi:hypothetical protein
VGQDKRRREAEFLLAVIAGRDPVIPTTAGVGGDRRIKSGNDHERRGIQD